MKPKSLRYWGSPLVVAMGLSTQPVFADAFIDALSGGKASGDIRFRYETVEQDNALDDANAFTVRTRLNYTTGTLSGFSGVLEMEDSRPVFGIDDYSVPPPVSYNLNEYSVIADPQTTELDQAFVQYKSKMVTVKGGRQVITYDGHRFVGHVGWRQDKQTFDALSAAITPIDNLAVNFAYVTQRNRIFAEAQDFDAKDKLLNISYKTPVGTVVGYGYFLDEVDEDKIHDTIGISFNGGVNLGSEDFKFLYALEFATQDYEYGVNDNEAKYSLIELGAKLAPVTLKLGMETLGSDDSQYGFSTPLATLHKFNGWADVFLGTPPVGLVDTYLSAAGKAGPVNIVFAYHTYEADDDTPTLSDLGSEFNLEVTGAIGKHYTVGVKAAFYDADDYQVDTDKIWVWTEIKF